MPEVYSASVLPYDHFRVPGFFPNAAICIHEWPDKLSSLLQSPDMSPDGGLFEVLVAGLGLLLYKYTGSSDIRVGAIACDREGRRVLVAVRLRMDHAAHFGDLVAQVKGETSWQAGKGSGPHDDAAVAEGIAAPRIGLAIEDNREGGGDGREGKAPGDGRNYDGLDMVFVYRLEAEGAVVNAVYNSSLYDEKTVLRFLRHYGLLLERALEGYDKELNGINMLSTQEYHLIRNVFNATKWEYDPASSALMKVFEDKVKLHPDQTAIIAGEAEWSYGAFNEKAARLAFLLRSKGVERGHVVAIMAERSVDMLAGIFGIIKAGAAYLPIDPRYPPERIRYMLTDSRVRFLLTREGVGLAGVAPGKAEATDQEMVVLTLDGSSGDRDVNEVINGGDEDPSALAYVIYTSGSTGYPKGVMIEQHSLMNRLRWMQRKYPANAQDLILHKTHFSFDVSVWEIFGWAVAGSRLCLLEKDAEKYCDVIIQAIAKNLVTVVHFVPSMLAIFLDYVEEMEVAGELSSLRQVFASGEALSAALVEKFNKLLPWCNLANLYGPTEATIETSYYDCPKDGVPDNIPIGKPIDNMEIYITDKDLQIVPIGVPGELCISGAGVARGYINQESLTRKQFVKVDWHEGQLYRTGDMGRWLPDGNIEYLGRSDAQVKVRGFRIELHEIEYHLQKHPDLRHAIVTTYTSGKTGETQIVAYIVTRGIVGVEQLRSWLSRSLPDYMIPAIFIPIDKAPLTPNHKVDKRALPDPSKAIIIE